MKFISWNVNGLRACVDKGFADTFRRLDADFFCLQETKLQEGQLDLSFDGYDAYWNYAEKKGYSGTAIFSRHKPLSVSYGIGVVEHDNEGRVITPLFLSRCGGHLFMVVIPLQGAREECRVAYRLFRGVGISERQTCRSFYPYRCVRVGPLPCGGGYRLVRRGGGGQKMSSPMP